MRIVLRKRMVGLASCLQSKPAQPPDVDWGRRGRILKSCQFSLHFFFDLRRAGWTRLQIKLQFDMCLNVAHRLSVLQR